MQICSKPDGLGDANPKPESAFSPKIMQINCQQMSTRWFGDVWRIRIPKLKLDLVPKSCKFAVNQMVWGMRILNLNLHLVPKSCKNNSKSARLEHQHPKSKIFKINFASYIEGFCRHLSHPFFERAESQN